MYVDGHGQVISDLLAGNIFVVPAYQRAFSWRASREIKDLWEDVQGAVRTNQSRYFLGTMLFAGTEDTGDSRTDPRRVVIDGQQRLTTLVLLLAALRDVLRKQDNIDTTLRQNKITLIDRKLSEFDGDRLRTRVVLGRHDQPQLEALLLPQESESSGLAAPQHESKNVKAAYAYLRREMERLVEAQGVEQLLQLLDTVLGGLLVVRIESPSIIDAHVVFEAVNDRGLPLTPAELMKNYVLSRAVFANEYDEAHGLWLEIESRIGHDNGAIENFLLYYWNSSHSPKVQSDHLYRKFKEEVRQYNLMEKLSDLDLEAELFAQLKTPTRAFWRNGEIVQALEEIAALGVKQVYILLLALGRCYIDSRLDASALSTVIEYLVEFSFRYSTVMALPTNVLEKLYSELATALRRSTGDVDLQPIFTKLGILRPSSNSFVEQLTTGGKILTPSVNRYVLFKIADHELGPEVNVVQQEHHLEHVIPQRPDAALGDALKQRGIEHEKILNQLGNLTVILGEWNQAMSNRDFAEKRPVYAQSILAMNHALSELEEFGNLQIATRQAEIARVADWLWAAETPPHYVGSPIP